MLNEHWTKKYRDHHMHNDAERIHSNEMNNHMYPKINGW